jgi:hypothetical protein
VDRGFSLRILNPQGRPGLARSASAPWPQEEHYEASSGLQAVAESLAALELHSAGHHSPALAAGRRRFRHGRPHLPGNSRPAPRETGPGTGENQHGAALSEHLLSQLAGHRHRGPLVALLGRLTVAEARLLAPAADYAAGALAILVVDRPEESSAVLEILRNGGWRATAVNSKTSLSSAWAYFDEEPSAGALQHAGRAAGERAASGRGAS